MLSPIKFDTRNNLYLSVKFLFSVFVLHSFQLADLADNVTAGIYKFVSLIAKSILSGVLPLPFADKTQWFVH